MVYQNVNIRNQNQVKSSKIELKYRTFYLSINIIKFLERLDYKQSIKIISDQLIRSITSVGANIVEAKSSSSKKEFLNYFQIALKSSNETKYWLKLLEKAEVSIKEDCRNLWQEAHELTLIFSKIVINSK